MQENMSKTFCMYFLSLCLLLHLFQAKCHKTALVPGLYVFGDSLVDSGNNNLLNTSAKVNYQPYGIDFPYGPTGRFTNGRTFADFLAIFLGLPFVPPYMGLSVDQKSKTTTGINYASGSAGILRESGSALGPNIPLEVQVEYFRETVNKYLPKNFKTKEDLSDHLSKSIFVVIIGSNDYLNNYIRPAQYNSSHLYTPQQFATILLKGLKQQLQEIYNLGARKFVVFNLGPLGCAPAVIQLERPKQGCAENVNEFIDPYDEGFPKMIQELITSLQGSTFVLGDINLFTEIMKHNPSTILRNLDLSIVKFDLPREIYNLVTGFISAFPCTELDSETKQSVPNVPPCKERDIHVFWDGFHPTQVVYLLLGVACFCGPVPCAPMNLMHLALYQQPATARSV